MFEDWYKIYPRKVGKLDAAKAYAAAIKKGTTDADLLAGLHRFISLIRSRGTDRTFIPHPATWLRQGRWQDDEGSERCSILEPNGLVQRKLPSNSGCGEFISRRIDAGSFSAYFTGCEFTETTVICPSQARADYIINKFRHKLQDIIIEVRK